jgi:phosphoribosylaminoimidazolecarboxamide formyltransferase / IMP cyclohydrolase
MKSQKRIKTALISVFNKKNLLDLTSVLQQFDIKIFSTGGTYDYLVKAGVEAIAIEEITSYPSILGGRVKTLHPKVFGGILARRNNISDTSEIEKYQIPEIDMVVVDLYPFGETLAQTNNEDEIIEKIDIGGISLIRAAAKNYADVLVVPSVELYNDAAQIIQSGSGTTTLEQRRIFAAHAFDVSSHYDTAIFDYFDKEQKTGVLKLNYSKGINLRYGENPHQKGRFFGKLHENFEQIHGKEISYNNLLDLDAGVNLIAEFNETTVAVLKHNNPCGLASRDNLLQAWQDALAGDPVSAFGGVIVSNKSIDVTTAEAINELFFEIILAPGYQHEALEILKSKKNRIILKHLKTPPQQKQIKTVLNGILFQDRDTKTETAGDLKFVTKTQADEKTIEDLLFANKIVKHTKSNAIVLAKNKQLLAAGGGQTSRIDALKHSIEKAKTFGFDLANAVMASDAFFPFPDSVEIAHKAGINAIIQPGGSIRDRQTIDFCDANHKAMAFTGVRHFRH